MQIKYKRIEEITPYENNPRKNDDAVESVARSINDFGFKVPIVVDKDGTIIAGHTRYKAAKYLGLNEVPVIYADDLNEEQVKAFRLADNKVAELAEWDFDKLDLELKGIELDMSTFGFELFDDYDDNDNDNNLQDIVEDEIPELEEEAKSKIGDIYQLSRHRLMCGDSTKSENIAKLMNNNKADMVFTDPPYGMHLDTDYSKRGIGKTYRKVIGDNDDFSDDLIHTVFDNFDYCNEVFLFGVDYYIDLIPNFKDGNLIVWDKTLASNGDAAYNSEFELLWTKTKHKKEVIHFNWFRYFGLSSQDLKTREHPTQKPLQVIIPFIERYSKADNIIVDIYGGSGSTLIACEKTNRVCYMMELDPLYVDLIIKRWENFTGQKAIKL